MIVVSNSSPIINLAVIGELELLKKIYGKIMIPGAVNIEITEKGRGQPGDMELRTSGWIEILEVNNKDLVKALAIDLHPGEAEAIVLAKEKNADLLIIDERKARTAAYRLGIHFIGLLGVLINAKQKGNIASVKFLMDNLIHDAGFWIDKELYLYVLATANE